MTVVTHEGNIDCNYSRTIFLLLFVKFGKTLVATKMLRSAGSSIRRGETRHSEASFWHGAIARKPGLYISMQIANFILYKCTKTLQKTRKALLLTLPSYFLISYNRNTKSHITKTDTRRVFAVVSPRIRKLERFFFVFGSDRLCFAKIRRVSLRYFDCDCRAKWAPLFLHNVVKTLVGNSERLFWTHGDVTGRLNSGYFTFV